MPKKVKHKIKTSLTLSGHAGEGKSIIVQNIIRKQYTDIESLMEGENISKEVQTMFKALQYIDGLKNMTNMLHMFPFLEGHIDPKVFKRIAKLHDVMFEKYPDKGENTIG